jgi:hypothetical protein
VETLSTQPCVPGGFIFLPRRAQRKNAKNLTLRSLRFYFFYHQVRKEPKLAFLAKPLCSWRFNFFTAKGEKKKRKEPNLAFLAVLFFLPQRAKRKNAKNLTLRSLRNHCVPCGLIFLPRRAQRKNAKGAKDLTLRNHCVPGGFIFFTAKFAKKKRKGRRATTLSPQPCVPCGLIF